MSKAKSFLSQLYEQKLSGKTGPGSGKFKHWHEAEVNPEGDGKTTSTKGDGPDHDHEIISHKVQEGGVDNHTHDELDVEQEINQDDYKN